MHIYESLYRVTDAMCLKNFHIKASGVLDLFQSIAGDHADRLGIGFKDISLKGYAWVLMRIRYDLVRPINHYEGLKLVTWPLQQGKVEWNRNLEIYDDSNTLVGTAVSKWVIINLETRRIVRRSEISLEGEFCDKVLYESLDKIDIEGLEFTPYTKRTVTPDQIDWVGHMNNTRYADTVDFNDTPLHFEINFINEAKVGSVLEIEECIKDNNTYYKGINSVGLTSFVMKVEE